MSVCQMRISAFAVAMALLLATLFLPARSHAAEAFTWYVEFPQYALLALKPGDTRETVMNALGKPKEVVSRMTINVATAVRQACRQSVYQHQLASIARYHEDYSYKRLGGRYTIDQEVLVFFDAQDRLCGAEVRRAWQMPGGITYALGLYADNPQGWGNATWQESRFPF